MTKVVTVCAQCSECQHEEIQKARVNGGSNYDYLKQLLSDFIFVVIEFLRCLLRLRRYERNSVEVGVFRRGMGQFEREFQREGGIAQQSLLVSEN